MELSFKAIVSTVLGLIVAVVLVFAGFALTEKVDDGYVTVVSTTSGGASETLDAGWHVVGVFDKTTAYPIRTQVAEGTVAVATSDNKRIDLPYTYEYNVNKDKVLDIFKRFGRQDIETIQSSFVKNRLNQVVKGVVGNYNVLEIRGSESGQASTEIFNQISESLAKEGFVITNVSLGIPDVDKKTQEAIDLQTQAVQEQDRKKTEQETTKIQSETDKINVTAKAEQKLIEANATAEANKIVRESITPELLQKQYIEKWNGVEPLVSGEGSSAILNIPEVKAEEKE